MNQPARGFALMVLALAAAAPAAAQQPAEAATVVVSPASGDTALWALIGRSVRARTNELRPAPPNENARVVAQYRDALADIEAGRYSDAILTLQAVLPRARENPLYHGELAYALLRAGQFDDAGNAYTRTFQLLQQNAWVLVGIAATRAAQRQWADAAGTIQLAAQTDSAVVTARVASFAAAWFEQAGDRNGSLAWARIAVARNPQDAPSWLRIATFLRARNDSTPEGPEAVRRFRALRPDDRLGTALYADLLFTADQTDSALALIATIAQDTAYHEFAAQMYLQSGRDRFQRRDTEGAIRVLNTGLPYATAAQRPAFSNIIGRSQLLQLNAALTALEETRACAPARAADSLVSVTERNLRDGLSFDSARTVSVLENILPQYRANAANAVRRCSDAQAAPTPARPLPPRRPAPAARPRP